MRERSKTAVALALVAMGVVAIGSLIALADRDAISARDILAATGVKGGLIVHLGSGDGKLTAALRANDSYLVHGLDPDPRNIERARQHLRSLGLYGKVSVEQWDQERLPYADNLVNLVVWEKPGKVSTSEVRRVLAPNGVAYINLGDRWTKTVKPRPTEIDEWTHYLHDASNNAVAQDSVVGPPRHMQWVGSPRWSRHHDRMASMSALVSTGGRIFYILDEGPTASIQLPPQWMLIARDAFNGTILWKRPISSWHPYLYPFKSGPAYLPRRLVAVGDRVYVTLGLEAPLTALDAATGKTIRTYRGTRATEEVIASEGVLFLLVNEMPVDWREFKPLVNNIGEEKSRVARDWPWDEKPRRIMAVRADSGKALWEQESPVVPLTLAADERRVVFHDGEKIVCLDRRNGEAMWRSEPVSRRPSIVTGFGPTLVLYEDVVLFSGGDRRQAGLSAETGQILWTADHPPSGHNSPEDLLVVDGLAWSGAIANTRNSGVFQGLDIHTGEVKSEFAPDVETYWFHHRCYRSKATENYLLPSRTGIEFVDPRAKHWEIHHWVRGGCIYGIMPCNGLVYAPMHDCACYPEAKLYGFNALAPESASLQVPREVPDGERLERGPAYGARVSGPSAAAAQDDWPTYRHDAVRSGFTKTSVPPRLKPAWRADLGGQLSTAVIAGGRVFVASVDMHTVQALDASSGDVLWSYTTGGRVDSPPTVHEGRVLFGSADGWVYCLRASDGALMWRVRAAPVERRIVAFEQLESAWPVHGSVLVQDGALYCVAGRSMFLDGGLRLLRLDPATGRKLSETVLDDRDPETGENLQVHVKILNMPVALPDVLSSDGRHLYMKSQVFDLQGVRQEVAPHSGNAAEQGSVQAGETAHLFAPMGFLDGSWFHRAYWVFGRSFAGGHSGYHQAGRFAPAGRILAVDDSSVYGYGRLPQYLRWTTPLEHQLFATSREIPPSGTTPTASGGSLVQIAKSESLSPVGKPVSVEAWVNAEKGDGVVLARGGPSHGYALVLRGGQPRFVIRADEKVSSVSAREKAVGKWVHLAGVLTAEKKLRLYVNGELAGSAEAHGLITSEPAQAMEIGADDGGAVGTYSSPFGFSGVIDEVRVYHGALTAVDVAQHYSTPRQAGAQTASLVLHISFDNGDAKDESGNGNDGEAVGVEMVDGRVGRAMKFSGSRARGVPTVIEHRWAQATPFYVRAMVLAGDTLFIAGPPDLIDEEEVFTSHGERETAAKLREQAAALEGRKGALLWAVSAADGAKLAEYDLEAPPVWDGMAAANGRLYLSTVDGEVLCMAAER
ncbi:MAG: PQQ-binding-like beta-propeller repeat protein [Armatimonadota bacterium]